MGYVVPVLVLIGVMILLHEAGHYVAARWFDVRVDVFSFGFGPRLFGFRHGETDFRVSAIPYGGYVKMAGEQPTDENINDPRAFLAKPRWQRMVIALAGPAMNLVLAVGLLTGIFMNEFPKPPSKEGVVGYVMPKSPAEKAGIRDGDRIVRINDTGDLSWDDIMFKAAQNANRPMRVEVARNGKQFWTTVTPVMDKHEDTGDAGWEKEGEVFISEVLPDTPAERSGVRKGDVLIEANGHSVRSLEYLPEIVQQSRGKPITLKYLREGQYRQVSVEPVHNPKGTPKWRIGVALKPVMIELPFLAALDESVNENLKNTTMIYQFLKGIAERRMSARSISGPIQIAILSHDAIDQGMLSFLYLMAMVSLNLAVFNLLPIPILDGGVIMLLLIETVMRRDLSMQVKEAVFKAGFVFLMAIMVFVIYNDLSKLLPPLG